MRTAQFSYTRPASVEAASSALQEADAVALAGGQALVQTMKVQRRVVPRLIDLNDLAELARISESANALEIGALVRVRELIEVPEIALRASALAAAAALLGDVQVRNRATIGGNVCFADPRANLVPALISLRAEIVLVAVDGTRVVPVADSFAGFRSSALPPASLVTAIRIPDAQGRAVGTYREVARQQNGTPIVNVAVTLVGDPIREAGVGVGGIATIPLRAHNAERSLLGAELRAIDAREVAGELTRGDAEPYEDLHAPAGYRLEVARVLLRRCLDDLKEKSRG